MLYKLLHKKTMKSNTSKNHHFLTNNNDKAAKDTSNNQHRLHVLVSMNPDGYRLAAKESQGTCYGLVGRLA